MWRLTVRSGDCAGTITFPKATSLHNSFLSTLEGFQEKNGTCVGITQELFNRLRTDSTREA